jgi:hypothetical protein
MKLQKSMEQKISYDVEYHCAVLIQNLFVLLMCRCYFLINGLDQYLYSDAMNKAHIQVIDSCL